MTGQVRLQAGGTAPQLTWHGSDGWGTSSLFGVAKVNNSVRVYANNSTNAVATFDAASVILQANTGADQFMACFTGGYEYCNLLGSTSLTAGGYLDVGGQIRTDNGTISIPGYSFGSDLNTGFYLVGADQLGTTVGGTNRWTTSTTEHTSTLPIVPGTDDTTALGSSSFAWSHLYVDTAVVGGANSKALLISDDDGVQLTDNGVDVTFSGRTLALPSSLSNDAATQPVLRLPMRLGSGPTTGSAPTCSSSTDAARLVYVDRSGDGVAADICVCAASSADAYAWRRIVDLTTACDLLP
jgi:hypothetical protein